MIYGIGCDIIEIARLQKLVEKFGNRFLKRIYTPAEIMNAPKIQQPNYFAYLAKRYAAKEAYSKALGTGIGQIIKFKNIEVLNDQRGSPYFNNPSVLDFSNRVHLTLSDEKNFAIAYVIIEKLS